MGLTGSVHTYNNFLMVERCSFFAVRMSIEIPQKERKNGSISWLSSKGETCDGEDLSLHLHLQMRVPTSLLCLLGATANF